MALTITLHPMVEAQLLAVAAGQGREPSDIVQQSLIETNGMQGVPLPDETVFGEREEPRRPHLRPDGLLA